MGTPSVVVGGTAGSPFWLVCVGTSGDTGGVWTDGVGVFNN